jgi:hypothetical protein
MPGDQRRLFKRGEPMFRFPRNYLVATILFAALNSPACSQAIDLVCSGTMRQFDPSPTNGAVERGATRVDLEHKRISTPVGNFWISKIEETKIWFEELGKQLVGEGSLDRLSGQMTIGHLEKLLSPVIADGTGVNVNESERERSGIICRQFCGVRRVGAIFRGAR